MSYTVASSLRLASFSPASPFTIYAIAAPENRGKLWSAVAEVMQQWLQAGPTEDEVQRTKLAFLQAAQRRRTDDFRVLSTLLELLDRGRGLADYAAEEQLIGGLEAEAIATASRQFWDPESWVYVTAGDFGGRG
jgi:zinc protease